MVSAIKRHLLCGGASHGDLELLPGAVCSNYAVKVGSVLDKRFAFVIEIIREDEFQLRVVRYGVGLVKFRVSDTSQTAENLAAGVAFD
jgi:hypothetical protein